MLSARLTKLEQAGPEEKPIIVVVEKDETQEQSFARAKRHPHRLVIIVGLYGCLDDPSKGSRLLVSNDAIHVLRYRCFLLVAKDRFFNLSVEGVKMKTRFRLISLWAALSVAGALTLGACAQTRGYQPMANPQADRNAYRYDQDLEYCKGQASQAAQTGTQAAQGALAGGAAGAAGGAITGSMSKNVPMGKGAAVGGALGALAGGAYGAYQGDQQYQTALWSCMQQLGHPVGY